MIMNATYEKQMITHPWIFWDDGFTDEQLQKVIDYSLTQPTKKGEVFKAGGEQETNAVRKSDIRFIDKAPDIAWFFEHMNNLIGILNERWYDYHLTGYDYFQYTEYHAEEQGHYDWHMDMTTGSTTNWQSATRKLSLSLVLNDDYEGGEFQFNTGGEDRALVAEQKKGRILAFPSFIQHRVLPVTKGVRKSIVIWVVGPKWT
jgi:PKHD-type hydroxylase